HISRCPSDSRRSPTQRGLALAAGTILLLSGCSFIGGRPTTVAPAPKLYEDGERLFLQEKYPQAREQFQWLVERHPESDLAPLGRFLIGETYFRSKDYEKAAPEVEKVLTPFSRNQGADPGQYRPARSHFRHMPTVEPDPKI